MMTAAFIRFNRENLMALERHGEVLTLIKPQTRTPKKPNSDAEKPHYPKSYISKSQNDKPKATSHGLDGKGSPMQI